MAGLWVRFRGKNASEARSKSQTAFALRKICLSLGTGHRKNCPSLAQGEQESRWDSRFAENSPVPKEGAKTGVQRHKESNGTPSLIGTNSGWAADPAISAVGDKIGTYSWGSSATADSALLVTLDPGLYTAVVSGAKGDTGNAVVEVFDVP